MRACSRPKTCATTPRCGCVRRSTRPACASVAICA
jgi:hypothetical protein